MPPEINQQEDFLANLDMDIESETAEDAIFLSGLIGQPDTRGDIISDREVSVLWGSS